jgi:hypothetical protein
MAKSGGEFAMRLRTSLAVSGLALSAFLIALPAGAQDRVGASGLPTTESTPAERAETRALNNQIQANNAAVDAQVAQDQANYQAQVAATNAQANVNDAQYQAQQQQYQNQLQQNQAAQQNYQAAKDDYEARNRAYYNLRARFAAERAAYRRGAWPSSWSTWRLQNDARLVGDRVEIIGGARVGTVDYVVRSSSGRIEALAVILDNGKQVWIDENDIRFNRNSRVIVTNLDRGDLYRMADLRG